MPNQNNPVQECLKCGLKFSEESHELLECFSQEPTIDAMGNIFRKHTRNPDFDINEWIVSIFSQSKCWENTFWRIWGVMNVLNCTTCAKYFACSELESCCVHPKPTSSSENGLCRSCQRPISAFSPFEVESGCCHVEHTIVSDSSEASMILCKLSHLIVPNMRKEPSDCDHFIPEFQLNRKAFVSALSAGSKEQKMPEKHYLQREQGIIILPDFEKMNNWINDLKVLI